VVAAKVDFKRELTEFYAARRSPTVVEVPELAFLVIDGHGDLNTSGEYRDAVSRCSPSPTRPGSRSSAGVDDRRASSHQLINPDIVWVLSVRDRVRNVSLCDDADRLAGLRLHDDESGRIRSLHQKGGRAQMIVLFNRRHRWMHDVRGRSRGRRRMLR